VVKRTLVDCFTPCESVDPCCIRVGTGSLKLWRCQAFLHKIWGIIGDVRECGYNSCICVTLHPTQIGYNQCAGRLERLYFTPMTVNELRISRSAILLLSSTFNITTTSLVLLESAIASAVIDENGLEWGCVDYS